MDAGRLGFLRGVLAAPMDSCNLSNNGWKTWNASCLLRPNQRTHWRMSEIKNSRYFFMIFTGRPTAIAIFIASALLGNEKIAAIDRYFS